MYLPEPSKHAFFTEGLSLTEQEHAKECDINVMLKKAARGLPVAGGAPQLYGHDDLTVDGVQHRINLEASHAELSRLARENEFDEDELKRIPLSVIKKFGFKAKKKDPTPKPASKNDDDLNDDEIQPSPDPQPPKEKPKKS